MVSGSQNLTPSSKATGVSKKPVTFDDLNPAQQAWVDYNVIQGVVTESDGSMTKLTVADFARKVGYDRRTCYDWTKNIPGFWDIVNKRRRQTMGGARTQKVWNSVFIAATVKLNTTAQQMWLANADPNFRMPSQKVEHEAGNSWAALMSNRRPAEAPEAEPAPAAAPAKSDPIEGEVVPDGQHVIE